MEYQVQAVIVLEVQAAMLLFLGLVMALVHWSSRRLKSNNGCAWFSLGALLGSIGLLLQSRYGTIHPLISVLLSNALFLSYIVFLTLAIGRVTQQRCKVFLILQAIVATAMLGTLAWFTWPHPSRPDRILTAMVAMPLLLAKPVILLLRARDAVIRPATVTLALLLSLASAGMLARAWTVAHGSMLVSSVSWIGLLFIAGNVICFLWIDMLRMSSQLESQAMSDPLTGLLNRRAMDTFAHRELARCQRQNQAIAALMIDLNGFKKVNDRYGHSVGDQVLFQTACVIRESLRAVDMAARVGGDEFLVLLPDASNTTVRSVSERLHQAIAEVRVATDSGEVIAVTASIGETRSTYRDVTLQDLMDKSDRDMYERKQSLAAQALPA